MEGTCQHRVRFGREEEVVSRSGSVGSEGLKSMAEQAARFPSRGNIKEGTKEGKTEEEGNKKAAQTIDCRRWGCGLGWVHLGMERRERCFRGKKRERERRRENVAMQFTHPLLYMLVNILSNDVRSSSTIYPKCIGILAEVYIKNLLKIFISKERFPFSA